MASHYAAAPPPPPRAVGKPLGDDGRLGESGRLLLQATLSAGAGGNARAQAQAQTQTPLPQLTPVPALTDDLTTVRGAVARFDELGLMLQVAGDANGLKARDDAQLAQLQSRLSATEAKLRKNRDAQPYQEKRLHRNAHPRFLHYLQFNREAKVERLQRELDQMRADEKRMEAEVLELRDHVAAQSRVCDVRARNAASVAEAQRERMRLFDWVVSVTPDTPAMVDIKHQRQAATRALQAESELHARLRETLLRVAAARDSFARAASELRAARMENTVAQVDNFGDMMSNRRDGFGEVAMQWDRDRRLNLARDLAFRGSDELQAALDDFPMEARVRYGDLTRRIGDAPLPDLRGANFLGTWAVGMAFGNFGDAMNNMHAGGKIQRNLAVLGQCESIAASQHALVGAVARAVDANLVQIRATLVALEERYQRERAVMFQLARSSVVAAASMAEVEVVDAGGESNPFAAYSSFLDGGVPVATVVAPADANGNGGWAF